MIEGKVTEWPEFKQPPIYHYTDLELWIVFGIRKAKMKPSSNATEQAAKAWLAWQREANENAPKEPTGDLLVGMYLALSAAYKVDKSKK